MLKLKRGTVTPSRLFSVLVATVAVGLVGLAPSAGAASYHIARAHNPVHAYRRMTPTSMVMFQVAPGGSIEISCQDYGPMVNGTRIWDLIVRPVSDPMGEWVAGWVSDYYASTPNFNAFSPGLRQCGVPFATTPYKWGLREMQAFARAAGQVGSSRQPDGRYWAGWCDRFVAFTYGRGSSGYPTALDHYNNLLARGLMHRGDPNNPPLGALLFYNTANAGGHVAFSQGEGSVITTPASPGQVVYSTSLNHFSNYLGWAYANPEWG